MKIRHIVIFNIISLSLMIIAAVVLPDCSSEQFCLIPLAPVIVLLILFFAIIVDIVALLIWLYERIKNKSKLKK